jgi:NTE family protein
MHGAFINNDDKYIDSKVLVSSDTLDELTLKGGSFGLAFTSNTLNRKQYANAGLAYNVSLNWFSLSEIYTPGSSLFNRFAEDQNRTWWRAKGSIQQYFIAGHYSSGYLLEGVLSDQPLFSNYYGTIINAPAFSPLQDSPTLILEKFRAFNYVAGGWRNVFSLRSNLDFRLEGYLFKPLRLIVPTATRQSSLEDDLTKLYFTGTAGLVFHSTIGPVSLSLNYYDEPRNQLGVLLHFGFLLYNRTSLE